MVSNDLTGHLVLVTGDEKEVGTAIVRRLIEHKVLTLCVGLDGARRWCDRQPILGQRNPVPTNCEMVRTSEAALESLTRYLAVMYAPQDIRVNTASATLTNGGGNGAASLRGAPA